MKARMRLEPAVHGGRFMRGVVVDDQVEIEPGGGVLIDQLEKVQKFPMAMARRERYESVRQTKFVARGCTLAANISGEVTNPAVILLHGWPHCKALYDQVINRLGERFFVLAFDLPDVGQSHGAPHSAQKDVLADLLLAAAELSGAQSIFLVGIDVGGMIAFAAARDHASRVKGIAIGNTAVPGIEPWQKIAADPNIWHFAFHSIPNLPEQLIAGRERSYFDFFFDALGSKQQPLTAEMREAFTFAYLRPESLKAGFDWYRAFPADATRNAQHNKIDTPLLYFRGDADGRTLDDYIAGFGASGARNVQGVVIPDTAEFTPIEAPDEFVAVISQFIDGCLS